MGGYNAPVQILVAGATGELGRAVAGELTRRGHRVRALARRGVPGVDVRIADALKPSTLRGSCDGVEAVFSCVGASTLPAFSRGWRKFTRFDTPANLHLLAESRRAGVRKFVYVGVAAADRLAHLDYVRAHELVVAALRSSGLEYAVIKPTGFFSAFAGMLPMARKGSLPIFGNGTARTNPIHEADLAGICADAIERGSGEEEVGGPEALTRRRIAELAFEAVGLPAVLRTAPEIPVRAAAFLLRPFHPRIAHLIPFYIDVWKLDHVAPMRGSRRLGEYLMARARDGSPVGPEPGPSGQNAWHKP